MTATAVAANEVVTFRVGAQWFGVAVLQVQEVICHQRIARVPLAPPGVAGLLNLRGQIVTAIDLHHRLEISRSSSESLMNVVVRDRDELFALIVDEVGDVAPVNPDTMDMLPRSVDEAWSRVCTGVIRMEQGLLAVLDVTRLLDETHTRP
jgi:purine-binding chemotaxis protein CheW